MQWDMKINSGEVIFELCIKTLDRNLSEPLTVSCHTWTGFRCPSEHPMAGVWKAEPCHTLHLLGGLDVALPVSSISCIYFLP